MNVGKVPLLKNIRTGLIDPDTPSSAMTKVSADGKMLNLVVGGGNGKLGGDVRWLRQSTVLRRVQQARPDFLFQGRPILSSCGSLVRRDAGLGGKGEKEFDPAPN